MARFVLVHGAFHGAWCWSPVVERLRGKGHDVIAIDLPGAGDDQTPLAEVTLDGYVDRVCRELDTPGAERTILVAHSAGGISATAAAAQMPERVAQLVYVAAFLPNDGDSLIGLTELPEGAGDLVQANAVIAGDPPIATMPPETTGETFYGSCSDQQIAWANARLVPQPLSVFVTPVSLGETGTRGIPRAYVICSQDKALPTPLQRRFVADNPCDPVFEIDTDHSPFLSATDELIDALDGIAAPRG